MTFQSENIRKYLHESGGFPLWTPYFYSGQPFMAIPEHYLFDLNFLYVLLFKNIYLAMNLSAISYFFLAGLGMYLLVYELIKKKNAAFIAAIVFMFNGLIHRFVISGHLNILESYAIMPFVFFFTYKALHNKTWLNNSIIAALFFSMMIYAGGMIFFLYTGLIIGFYMAWNSIGKNFKKRLAKAVFVSSVIGILLIGLSALKLLPVLEFAEMSNRGMGISYQEYLGYPINLGSLWDHLINLSYGGGFSGAIGITSLALLLFGLLSFRKKIVMFSILLVILSVLLASGTFVAKFFYQLPGFGQMRHIERALVMFVFAAPVLAAYGYDNLAAILKKYKKNTKNTMEIFLFLIISASMVSEMMLMQEFPKSIRVVNPAEIPIVNELGKDSSEFRIANYALSTPIGASGYNYLIQLGIPSIKGGGGIWIGEYAQYLAIAQQAAPSKMFGILNGKYVISDREINDEGLTLAGKFQDCKECPVWEAYGPYLYENKNAVPRAFIVNSSVLVTGNDNDKTSLIYRLILENLNPLSTAVIEGKNSIAEHSIDELMNFDNIILLRDSVTQNDVPKLQQYIKAGKKILPNLLEGENSISSESIAGIFNSAMTFKEFELKEISVNEFSVDLKGGEGWLVLSERFAHFPGWKAIINGKGLRLYKADSVISAVHLNGEKGSLTFKYEPDSFKNGKLITSLTILLLAIYLFYVAYSGIKKWQK